MKVLWSVLCAAALLLAPVMAVASVTTTGAGKVPSGGGGGYVGPGDLVSSAKAWYGVRAYSAAVAASGTQKAMQLVRASDSMACDVLIAMSGDLGNVVTTGGCTASGAASAFCNATTCTVAVWYDQSGGGLTANQTTAANQPTLTFNCLGTHPCVTFGGTQWFNSAIGSTAQPLTISAVAERTSSFTTQNSLFTAGTGVFWKSAANTIYFQFGAALQITSGVNDGVWHAMQFAANSSSSSYNIDGTASGTVSVGSSSLTSVFIGASTSSGTNPLFGQVAEAGLWPAAFTPTQQASVCHNQSAYFGTSASC